MNSSELRAPKESVEVQLKQKEQVINKLEEINAAQAEQISHHDAQLARLRKMEAENEARRRSSIGGIPVNSGNASRVAVMTVDRPVVQPSDKQFSVAASIGNAVNQCSDSGSVASQASGIADCVTRMSSGELQEVLTAISFRGLHLGGHLDSALNAPPTKIPIAFQPTPDLW